MALIGAKGGRRGKGKHKTMDREHYRQMGIASGKARRSKKKLDT
jgi:hypothetical protein